jgi:PadR family transcriptional regulator AphA
VNFPGSWSDVAAAEYFILYGTIRSMSSKRLTPTSYLVLGLLAREGPSTPYDLERHVRATLGNFWSFPHTLLYTEPPRLAADGLVTESREEEGRRRRVFTITPAGVSALTAWLDHPSNAPTELRDLGLLQLFFADLVSAGARLRLAEQQLAIHRAKLAAYLEDARLEEPRDTPERGKRTTEHGRRTTERWRGETLRMGLRYEEAAVGFWEGIVSDARVPLTRTDTEGATRGGPPTADASPKIRTRP